jgi:large subunit ribosomal protein L6
MSLIGSKPVQLEKDITVSVERNTVTVKGPKGELSQSLPLDTLKIQISPEAVEVTRKNEEKQTKAYHGLVRSIIQNMVQGVAQGFSKKLELVGTGYRVVKQADGLSFSLGYSHPIEFPTPEGITFDVEGNNVVIVSGIDKQRVGQTAAEIRSLRKPEPYKGKGVRYEGEVVRRKAGKTTTV